MRRVIVYVCLCIDLYLFFSVAALVDDSIMVTLIPLVSQQLVTHKDNVEVVVHACKAISQLAHHSMFRLLHSPVTVILFLE